MRDGDDDSGSCGCIVVLCRYWICDCINRLAVCFIEIGQITVDTIKNERRYETRLSLVVIFLSITSVNGEVVKFSCLDSHVAFY